MAMKPIETRYKGYRFRSRLEARVAVYLDAIGWRWEYEPEGYELDGYRYLPDFRISWDAEGGGQCWIEVKAVEPNEVEKEKARRLVELTGTPIVFIVGTPDPVKTVYGLDGFQDCMTDEGVKYCPNLISLGAYCMSKWGRPGWFMYDEQPSRFDIEACNAARSARFEFGESGATV